MKSTIVVRTLLLSAFLGAGAAADPAFAQININIGVAPPAPQYEVVPSIAPGYIWAPGYWAWNGDRHIWIRGRPIVQREGYRWEPDRWEQRGNGYYRHEGRWEQEKQKKPKKAKHGHKDDDHHGKKGG
jgi:hypothetical protein